MKQKIKLLWLLCPVLVSGMASCISFGSDLDLDKDLRLDMHLGGDRLVIPLGNLDRITLDSVIDIDPDDPDAVIRKTDGNSYAMVVEGTLDPTAVKVKDIDIQIGQLEIDPINASFEDQTPAELIGMGVPVNVLEAPIASQARLWFSPKANEVKMVSELTLQDKAPVSVKFTFQGFPASLDSLELEDLKIGMPKFATVQYTGNDPRVTLSADGKSLVINGKLTNSEFHNGGPGFIIDGLAITENLVFDTPVYATEGDGLLYYNDYLDITGKVRIESRTTTLDELTSVKITPDIRVADMKVKSMKGLVCPAINEVDQIVKITVDEDAEFLHNRENRFVFNDMSVRLGIETNFGVPLTMGMELSSERADGTLICDTITPDSRFSIPASVPGTFRHTDLILTKKGVAPADAKPNSSYAAMPEIDDLMSEIPSVIRVGIMTEADLADPGVIHEIDLTQEMQVKADYSVTVPLSFDSLSLHYETDIDGLAEDMEDISDAISRTDILLKANVTSTVPISLKISALPIDKSGRVLNGIQVTDVRIPAGSISSPANRSAEFHIAYDGSGSLSRLDGFRLGIVCNSAEGGAALTSDQYIEMTDMSLQFLGGLDIDFTDVNDD